MTLETVKTIADIFQSLFTIGGIVAALVWFKRQRSTYPAAQLVLSATHSVRDEKLYLFSVRVRMKNIGRVKIEVPEAIATLAVIAPFQGHVADMALARRDEEKSGHIIWNDYRTVKSERPFFLEPGEENQLQFDFPDVERTAQKVGVYIHVKNAVLTKSQLSIEKEGWKALGEYDFAQSHLFT
jgi:hypothetical protein